MSSMLVKFEPKTSRVKCLSFNNKRPLLLVALYSGQIQLWDYRLCTLVEKYEEHEGPVRSANFHPDQPIFASGGDDTTIKVWNFNKKKCLFTLSGHVDYIRSVFFHHENPWIISACDDHTIRIWNWQARNCISTITGHSHYVMCAQFHPVQPLIVSCSLDQTIRIWDYTGLKNKFFSITPNKEHNRNKLSSIDVLVPMDVIVKNILEGHEQGVNWVSFHPKESIIISSSDDRQIKLWRYTDNSAFEIDTMRGHYHSVCCSIFSSKGDLIISASEDKSIRIWDANKHIYLFTYRRETDRFWCLTSCPNSSIIAAGHDNGFLVFKLNREKPAYDIYNNCVLYIKDKYLKKVDLQTMKDTTIVELKNNLRIKPSYIYYNAIENMLLCNYNTMSVENIDNTLVEIYQLTDNLKVSDEIVEPIKYISISGVWVSRNRISVIDKNGQIVIKNVKNPSHTNTLTLDIGSCTNLFSADTAGLVLAQISDKIYLIDVKDNFVINSITCPKVRFLQWSHDHAYVALFSKKNITICTKKLEIIFTYTEAISVKSAVFICDNSSILIYTTPCHIKYILIHSGDRGIVRTIDVVLYVVHVKDKLFTCLDREVRPRVISIDNTEYLFKIAILEKRYENVIDIIRSSNLIGQALISFVRERGIPEIALHFIKDDVTRFHLALECSNLTISLDMAKLLDKDEYWNKLYNHAIKLANITIAEEALIRLKDFQQLSFLYCICGNINKLQNLYKHDHNSNSRISSLIYNGDIENLCKVLSNSNENPLAYAIAHSYSLENVENIKSKLANDGIQPVFPPNKSLKSIFSIQKPQRMISDSWPKLNVSRSIFDIIADKKSDKLNLIDKDNIKNDSEINHIWNEDVDDILHNADENKQPNDKESSVHDAWQISDEDIDIDVGSEHYNDTTMSIMIESHSLYPQNFNEKNILIFDIMRGSFINVFSTLKEQFGICNFTPLKELFLNIYTFSKILIPNYNPIKPIFTYPICCISNNESPLTMKYIRKNIQSCYTLTTNGKFQEALSNFTSLLHECAFVIINDRKELQEIINIVRSCREYVIGLSMELQRRSLLQSNINRSCELAAYFTHCELQSQHLILVLRIAMNLFFKIQNYQTASVLSKRLLDLAPSMDMCTQARKIITACEKYGNINQIELNYDPYNPFDICCSSFQPIYKGDKKISCSYCSANYKPQYDQSICNICQIGQVGISASGFNITTK